MKDVVELINRLYNIPDHSRYDISVSIWMEMQLNSFWHHCIFTIQVYVE